MSKLLEYDEDKILSDFDRKLMSLLGPRQGFFHTDGKKKTAPRNKLYFEYLRFVELFAKSCCNRNVRGILTRDKGLQKTE